MPTPRRLTRNLSPSSTPRPAPGSASATPATPAHPAHPAPHHRTADELALEEAASLLHTPTGRLRSSAGSAGSAGGEAGLEAGSARALRHRRLNEVDSDDTSDAEDARMEQLLQAAREAACAKAPVAAAAGTGTGADDSDEVVLQFDEDPSEKKREAPIPDLSVPRLPNTHLAFSRDGRAHSSTAVPPSKRHQEKGKAPAVPAVPELDDRPYERPLSKKEKAALPRKATTSELWAAIPAPRTDMLPQMRRDYQALALANSLDPKRFMKGGSKSDKVPESFAIGTMVEAPRQVRDTTVGKERRYRPGQVVSGLVRDEEMGAYAKRKYGDLQWNRMENGRGKGRAKRSKW